MTKETLEKTYREYQRREQERLRRIMKNQEAKYDRLQRLLQIKEGKESEFDMLSRAIEDQVPGLTHDEKLLLVYSAISQLEQRAGTDSVSSGFYRHLSTKRIQETIIRQIELISRYTKQDPTETVRQFLHHGVVQKPSQEKR